MITGRKIANGSNGKGEAPVMKTPLIGDSEPKCVWDHDRQPGRAALARRQVGALEAEPQTDRDNPMGHQLVCRGRNAARRDKRLPIDQHNPQDRQRDDPKQGVPSGTRRDDISGNGGGGHQRSSM
jgi:hypothetical protein